MRIFFRILGLKVDKKSKRHYTTIERIAECLSQSQTEINTPWDGAAILRRICQLMLTRIARQVSRVFDLKKRLSAKKYKEEVYYGRV